MDVLIGILNSHMFGTEDEPSEHVEWSKPDVMTEAEWVEMLGMSTALYAQCSPHMVVFEVSS